MKKILVLIFAVVMLIGVAVPTYAITNGEPDAGRHPYVGLVVFDAYVPGQGIIPAWRTSGILISPNIVLTAGHGTDGAVAARVWFNEDLESNTEYPYGGSTSIEGTPHTYPFYDYETPTGDVGIVVLDEPINIISEYGELPTAGIIDTLPIMTDVDLVGYGAQNIMVKVPGSRPYLTGLKVRLLANAKFLGSQVLGKRVGDDIVAITANPGQGKGGSANGDSGGAVLLKDTDTIIAMPAYRINPLSKGIGLAQRVDTPEILEWINSFLP